MPAKRKYKVKGTKDFIVLAGIFFFLCLWAVKDAWYPSPNVLKKHPLEVDVSFETEGSVGQLHVAEGDQIIEDQVLAELRRVKLQEDFETAKQAYTEARDRHARADEALRSAVKNGASGEGIAALKQSRVDAQVAMDTALEQVGTMRKKIDSTKLLSPEKGVVKEVRVSVHDQVEAGETVMVIDPKDHFYLFNKSLAIISFIAFWIFLGVHFLAQ